MTLTNHTTAMNLVIQFSGNGVIPRERLSPRSQFFVSTTSKQRTETLVAHWQVVQDLQHLNQNRDGYSVQHNRLERVTKVARVNHLETV